MLNHQRQRAGLVTAAYTFLLPISHGAQHIIYLSPIRVYYHTCTEICTNAVASVWSPTLRGRILLYPLKEL
jgi:hypothetical protein